MAENGPWDSSVTQQFIEPLIDNLTTVLKAGEAAVHAEVNGGQPMPPYQVWRIAKWLNTKFPACSVIASKSTTFKDEDERSIKEKHVVEVFIEDVGGDPDYLARSVMKRVKAAHIIIERATLGALFNGFVPSRSQRPYWDIDHNYIGFWNERKSTYFQYGSLIITFNGLMEKT